jgi:flagellar motor switch protein FliG
MPAERFETLTGAEKAAILMLALGEEQAAPVFAKLELERFAC